MLTGHKRNRLSMKVKKASEPIQLLYVTPRTRRTQEFTMTAMRLHNSHWCIIIKSEGRRTVAALSLFVAGQNRRKPAIFKRPSPALTNFILQKTQHTSQQQTMRLLFLSIAMTMAHAKTCLMLYQMADNNLEFYLRQDYEEFSLSAHRVMQAV